MFSILHPIKSIKRKKLMGIFKGIAKIENLIETRTNIKFYNWINGYITVKSLPDRYKRALLQFGYEEKTPIFGVNCDSVNESRDKCDLTYIGLKKSSDDWTSLLYDDVDRNWRVEEMFVKAKFGSPEYEDACKKNEQILEECYERLSKLFIFLDLYIKHREELVKLIKIEYDMN